VAEVPAQPERLTVAGPAGSLEALAAVPVAFDGKSAAIVCHPHPLHGGTLHNKVVHTMARTFEEMGLASVRFNFRGVGASAGTFEDGVGETEDARAAADWARQRWPGIELWLAGFSFGVFVAARLAADAQVAPRVRRLVSVAPPVRRFVEPGWVSPSAPWLIVQGDADDLVDVNEVRRWVGSQMPPPRLIVLEGVGHYFHGRLHELKDVLRTQLAG
jgi:alpha/beta superfamily hydrolase